MIIQEAAGFQHTSLTVKFTFISPIVCVIFALSERKQRRRLNG